MTNQTRDVIVMFLLLTYNALLLLGTAALVVFYEWSAWWFLFTIFLMASKFSTKDD